MAQMATMIAAGTVNKYVGTSDETKPNDQYVPHGSSFYEMDTSTRYMFKRTSASGGSWLKQTGGGGGGGGGGDLPEGYEWADAGDIDDLFANTDDINNLFP